MEVAVVRSHCWLRRRRVGGSDVIAVEVLMSWWQRWRSGRRCDTVVVVMERKIEEELRERIQIYDTIFFLLYSKV